MPSLPSPRAVFFDWDGTVVDSFDSIVAAHNAVRSHFGEPAHSPAEVLDIVQLGHGRAIFEQLYTDVVKAQEAIDVYYKSVPNLRRNKLHFMPGIERVIETLHAQHIPLAVVSNMAQHALIDEVTHMGMKPKFQSLIGATDFRPGKPAPDPIYAAAQEMDITRDDLSQVWFVGDMMADQKAAQAAGCPFVFYTKGIAHAAEQQGMQADLRLSHYDELSAIIGTFSRSKSF